MKATYVSIKPSVLSAERPALTPELLATVGARYSRSNEGLDAILAQIDHSDPEASVDRIFRMVDYGHASIGDLVPIAIFMDGITMNLAALIFQECQTASGQESSTRYIKLDPSGLADPETLGIADHRQQDYHRLLGACFTAYQQATTLWEDYLSANPDELVLPEGCKPKEAERIRKNYALDRARYFLPIATRTNMMLVQSARSWCQLITTLLSHPWKEANLLGNYLVKELELGAPRLAKHARYSMHEQAMIENDILSWEECSVDVLSRGTWALEAPSNVFLRTSTFGLEALQKFRADIKGFDPKNPDLEYCLATTRTHFHHLPAEALRGRPNRYARIGDDLRRVTVRWGLEACARAELRDLFRHRTGNRHAPLVPVGFYCALDQVERQVTLGEETYLALYQLVNTVVRPVLEMELSRRQQSPQTGDHTYWGLLGTQYPFEHVTQADKFIYEAELRTGRGAHFRYAQHLRDALALWYTEFPQTRGLVLEGGAEPE